MEIVFPSGPKYPIYADSETYTTIPHDTELGTLKGTPGFTKYLETCGQVPWLLAGEMRPIHRKKDSNKFYITGKGFSYYTYICENWHEPFFMALKAVYENKHIPVIHFHNTSFDITALAYIFKKLDPDLVLYTYNKKENKKFLSGAMHSPKYGFKAQIVDTLLYDATISVEKMGSSLGLPKIEGIPYTCANVCFNIETDEFNYLDMTDGVRKSYPLSKIVEYAQRDVEITRIYDQKRNGIKDRIGQVILDIPNEEWDKIKTTVGDFTKAGHSKSIFNVFLKREGYTSLDHSFRFEMTEELYKQTFRSNMGGFTSYNKHIRKYICDETEKIGVFDANSLYPHCMSQPLPYDKLLDTPPNSCHYVEGLVIYCYKAEGKDSMEFLYSRPISVDRISIKKPDVKPITIYVPKGYIDGLEKNDADLDYVIVDRKYQKTTPITKKYMDALYKKRQEILAEKKQHKEKSKEWEQCDIDQRWVKDMMNSIYGKFCERTHLLNSFYTAKSYEYRSYQKADVVYRSVLTGSYITFQGRLELFKKIKACVDKGGKVLYCDTDSVMVVMPKDEDGTSVFGKDTGGKGEWKNEGYFDIFLNNSVKKKYCLLNTDNSNHKFALSGIGKEFLKAVKSGLKEDVNKTINDLIYIFDPENGIILKDLKKVSVLNKVYSQIMIFNTDFKFNPRVKKLDAYVYVEDGKYRIEKVDDGEG